jgi:hypothetical protein
MQTSDSFHNRIKSKTGGFLFQCHRRTCLLAV